MAQALRSAVAKTVRKLEKAKPSARGLIATSGTDLFELEIVSASTGRAIAFLNTLAAAAEARGFRIVSGDKALGLVVDDETLDLKIIEQITRPKHEPTEAAPPPCLTGAPAEQQLGSGGEARWPRRIRFPGFSTLKVLLERIALGNHAARARRPPGAA